MRFQASDVRPGKCFVTIGDRRQVRRVRNVVDGVVHYEARGAKPTTAAWPTRAEALVDVFLADIEREVGSDHVVTSAPRINV